jgi:hypothetical protein
MGHESGSAEVDQARSVPNSGPVLTSSALSPGRSDRSSGPCRWPRKQIRQLLADQRTGVEIVGSWRSIRHARATRCRARAVGGAEPLGHDDRAQADGTIADDGHGAPVLTQPARAAWVTGAHDVGEGAQARDHRGVGPAARHRDEGAVGERDPDPFARAGVGVPPVVDVAAPEPAAKTRHGTWISDRWRGSELSRRCPRRH